MSKNIKPTEAIEKLFDALRALESKQDFYNFFDDLCTVNEVSSLAQRFEIACLLDKKITYSEIESKTAASAATISRINKFLINGSNGYRTAIDKLNKEQ